MSQEISDLLFSLKTPSVHEWMFAESRHANEVYSSDDELLRMLDKISHTLLTSNENDLSLDMDSLSSEY